MPLESGERTLVDLIRARQEGLGHRPLGDAVELYRAKLFDAEMRDFNIPLKDYELVYKMATRIYNESPVGQAPFGIDFITKACMQYQVASRPVKVFERPRNALPARRCASCVGSGVSQRVENGKRFINYDLKDGKKVPRVCEDCKRNDS